jgi:hypothetical protein
MYEHPCTPSRSRHCLLPRVRGAHNSINPGVRRAKRANPRIAIQEGFQPAERATDLMRGDKLDLPGATPLWIDLMTPRAVTRSAGSFRVMDRDPGAHAPGFTLSCATRTALLKNRKITKRDSDRGS